MDEVEITGWREKGRAEQAKSNEDKERHILHVLICNLEEFVVLPVGNFFFVCLF